jgi:peptidoglycan-N-acetylglucosamine deacetylase
VVALTFDAGANGDGLPSILTTLQATGTKATFFLTGAFASQFPGLAAQVARAGYRIGDHSVDHPYFTRLSNAQIDAEVLGAAQTIRQVTGADPAPLFRFPYGDSDARTLAEVNRLGYVAVGWTVDTLGWEGTSKGITADEVVNRVMTGLQPGEIVLMHVGSNPTDHSTLDADALPRVIAAITAAGYSFVTVDGRS